jgi:hypothetical protein
VTIAINEHAVPALEQKGGQEGLTRSTSPRAVEQVSKSVDIEQVPSPAPFVQQCVPQ